MYVAVSYSDYLLIYNSIIKLINHCLRIKSLIKQKIYFTNKKPAYMK